MVYTKKGRERDYDRKWHSQDTWGYNCKLKQETSKTEKQNHDIFPWYVLSADISMKGRRVLHK